MCTVSIGDKVHDGYPPLDLGVGGNSDIEFELCLDCGQMQGTFPLPESDLEKSEGEDGGSDVEADEGDISDIADIASGLASSQPDPGPSDFGSSSSGSDLGSSSFD
jgi:hypothetical protein